jgi:hypothetical protein
LIKAREVSYRVHGESRRVSSKASAMSLEKTKKAQRAHQMEGLVDMVIRKDNVRSLLQYVCRQPGGNLH